MVKTDEEKKIEQYEKRGPHPINIDALKRLNIIEGQIRGIQKMIDDAKYCVDIITQISAVRSALSNVGKLILRRHIERCVTDAIKNNGRNSKEVIDELMAIFLKEEK
jgi:DNA-binding FrmR family transcriptional regulator